MFESLIGLRYLINTKQSYALRLFFLVGLNLFFNGLGVTLFMPGAEPLVALLGMLFLILGALLSYVCLIAMMLSVYTVISVVGVTVGVAALTIVISVMSGFEQDLQDKILGANAHVVVRKESGGDIEDWQKLQEIVRDTPGLTGISPYLEDEVIATSSTGLSGAVVKGIDPDTISDVSDLAAYLKAGQGRIEYLIDPETIANDFPIFTLPLDTQPFSLPDTEPARELPDRFKPAPPHFLDDEFPGDPYRPLHNKRIDLNEIPLDVPPSVEPGFIEVPSAPPTTPPLFMQPAKRLPGVLLGKQLAEKTLHVSVGDEVSLVTPWGEIGPTGPMPKSRSFRVAGIFYSGMYEHDAKNAYILLPEANKFFSVEGAVTGFEVRVYRIDQAAEIAAVIQAKLDAASPGEFEAVPWQELNRSLFSALKVEKQMMFMVLIIIIIVASFFIVSSLLMVVIQKRKELAILMSMGATSTMLLRIFFAAGAFIGIIGTGVGVLGGYLVCKLVQWRGVPIPTDVYYISSLPVVIDPLEFLLVGAAALAMSLLATLYPSKLAASLKPMEGLRS